MLILCKVTREGKHSFCCCFGSRR